MTAGQIGCGLQQPASAGGGSGLTEVDAWADRPVSPADGDEIYIRAWNAAFTFTALAGGKWLPSAWMRDTSGDPMMLAVGQDVDGNDLRVYADGPDFPAEWTQAGTNSVDADAVRIGRYVYAETASVAPRVILYVELFALPSSSTDATTNVGVLAGSKRGGTDYITGAIFRSDTAPIPLDMGRFNVPQVTTGQAFADVGTPIWVLLDFSSANGACSVTDKDAPLLGLQSERSLVPLATAWLEMMNMDALSNAMPEPLELLEVVAFDVG